MKPGKKEPTFVGVRQCDFEMRAETCIDFVPKAEGTEAGLTLRHGNGQHYDVCIATVGKQRYVKAQFKFGFVNQVYKQPIPKEGKVYLRIDSEKKRYTLSYSLDNKIWKELGKMDSQFLAGGFSGLLVGLYAETKKETQSEAIFGYFDYVVSNG